MIKKYIMFNSLFYLDCLDFQNLSIPEIECQSNSAIVRCFDCPSRRNFILGDHCTVTDAIPHSKVNKTSNCILSLSYEKNCQVYNGDRKVCSG